MHSILLWVFFALQIDYGDSKYPFQNFPKPSDTSSPVVTEPQQDNENSTAPHPTPSSKRVQRATPTYLSWDLKEVISVSRHAVFNYVLNSIKEREMRVWRGLQSYYQENYE